MRAIAALVVFLNHAYAQAWVRVDGHGPDGILAPLSYSMVAGHLSVTIFIVISGFCLALPVVRHAGRLQNGALAFFKRRARRILPPYYAALALSLALIAAVIGKPTGTLWDVPIQVTPTAIVSHVLLLQDLFATGSINYVFWSIAVEWQIYFLFPFLVWSWSRFGPAKTVIAALLAGYALRYGFADTRLTRANPHFIGMFALGVLAAFVATSERQLYIRLRTIVPWTLIGAVTFVTACAIALFWNVTEHALRFPVLDLVIGAMACSVLALTTRDRDGTLTRAFSYKPLAFLGTFSYSFYLVHAPLLQIMWQYVLSPAGLGPAATFCWLMTAGLLATLAFAYAFFRLFEAPFMRAAARTGRTGQAAAEPAR